MKRVVVGVVVALMLVGAAVWTSGCGKEAAPTPGTATTAKPAPAAVPSTPEDIAKVATTVPKDQWKTYPPEVQQKLEAYAKDHPEQAQAGVPKLTDAQLEQMSKQVPKDQWKNMPESIRTQLEAYVKAHGG